ncbi:diphosphomevalonate decarboxylase [Bdellovibrionota bacterium FG-1]
MSSATFLARAPSNIALIKYMGKKDATANLPENPSLSVTLNGLCSWVEIQRSASEPGRVRWIAELPHAAQGELLVPSLSSEGQQKVIAHVERCISLAPEVFAQHGLSSLPDARSRFCYNVRSANTFPSASGIASSASSFAAFTLASFAACSKDRDAFARAFKTDLAFRRHLARVSRVGSGSSCRSFEGPFVFWEEEHAFAISTRMPELRHFVILVSSEPKAVSSSQAHLQVKTSPLWQGRPERVQKRTDHMKQALEVGDLFSVARLAWSEFWEMHSLFHTAAEPFSYWQAGSIEALHWLSPFVVPKSSSAIVTMDAGPNIHVLVAAEQAEAWRQRLHDRFGVKAILEDRPGSGAVLYE